MPGCHSNEGSHSLVGQLMGEEVEENRAATWTRLDGRRPNWAQKWLHSKLRPISFSHQQQILILRRFI